ncbi:glycoside hydrolase family 48 protein [Streptomyces stelliscabiei]
MHPRRRRRASRRLWTAVVAAFALPLTMLGTGSTSASAAAVACNVDYKTNDWGSGFTAELTITNRGTEAIDGWTLTYAYAGNQTLSNGWSGTWSQSGKAVTAKNASWNGRIAVGAAVTTGAQFTYSGANAAPTGFAINGTTCVGAHQPPITVLTSPAPGAVYSQGTAVPMAATAAAADSATVTKVEFYDDTTLLGTDTTAPYTHSATGLGVGSHSLVAKAYDSLGASASSTPVGITVASGPAVVVSPTQLGVRQGQSGTYDVKLSTQPSGNVTVTTARASGNTGLSVTGGGSLTFTPSNWNTAQKVTIGANASGTGSAVFDSTATGHAKASVTVTQLAASSTYDERFLEMYGKITNPANGYFSPEGIPYHSVETLIVEAPDHGHETTSEAYSYLLWLQAMYGKVTGDWSKFNGAWEIMEKYMIPTKPDQPTNSFYNASKPATYAPSTTPPTSTRHSSTPVSRSARTPSPRS